MNINNLSEQLLTNIFSSNLFYDNNDNNINKDKHKDLYIKFIITLIEQHNVTDSICADSICADSICADSINVLYNSSFSYKQVQDIAFQLYLQIHILEQLGFTMLFLQKSDILVITIKDKLFYFIANLSQIVPIYNKSPDYLILKYISVSSFPQNVCAPEIYHAKSLPFITHKTAVYYSIGLLCLKLLNLSLNNLKGTKLFYFLERSMNSDPSKRSLLFL